MAKYDFKPGDHIKAKRRLYSHHGIYTGDNTVIHYAPPPGMAIGDGIGWQQVLGANSSLNTIHETSLENFIGDDRSEVSVVAYKAATSYPPLKVIARARSRLGENGYNLWGNNCEHLCAWCKKVQDPEERNALWTRMKDGALLGVSTTAKSRQWKVMLAGAGLGVIAGATKYWLEDRALYSSYDEFAAYASTLYFSLTSKQRPYPVGQAFFHSNQSYQKTLPVIPEDVPDNEILFVCTGGWLGKPARTDWFITERAVIQPGRQIYIDLHRIADISAHMGKLQISDIDDNHYLLPVRFLHADSLARFIKAAIGGLPIEPETLAITRLSRLHQFLLGCLLRNQLLNKSVT